MDEAKTKLITNFLNSLLKLIRYFKLYPPNHPYIATMVDETEKARVDTFAQVENIKVAIMGGVMFLGKDPVENPNAMLKNLIKMLGNVKIKSFEMSKKMNTDEMQEFCRLASKDKEELCMDGGKGDFNSAILKDYKMTNVQVNEIQVKFDGEDGGGGIGSEALAMLAGVDEALGIVADKTKGGGGVALSEDKLMTMVDAILSRVQVPADGGKTDVTKSKRSFDEIGDMLSSQCDNINDLKTNLLKTVFKMPSQVQKDIFGESYNDEEEIEMDKMLLNLSIKSRANIVRNALKSDNMDMAALRATMSEVVGEESEVVDLAEIITKEFGLTSKTEDEKKEYISRLSALIQSGLVSKTTVDGERSFKPRIRGTILIAEDDMETMKVYQRYLHPAGFETVVYTDGQQALAGIQEHKPHMIILDLKLPSLHGLDIIYFLRKNKEFRVPVIICSAFTEFQNEFEIRSYPKCEFLTKPIDKGKFLEAIEKHAPPAPQREPGIPEQEQEKTAEQIQHEEDMEKARGVQAKLLPDSLPDLVGFDIGTFYCSCKDVGGDYFDIIPIDNRHTGILIADVSGKGVSGAMVMVMVRSVTKLIAPNHLSPRQALIELNGLISKDMKMGMFVTVLYMILDEVERTLKVCCAGHNPAVIWNQKTMSATYMKPSGMALGITNSSVFQNALKDEDVQLNTGDMICIYTDGVVEAMSPQYEEYGEALLAKVISDNINRSCEEIIDSIYESIQTHEDTAPRHDDVSIIALKSI